MADWSYGNITSNWQAACGFSTSWDGYGQTFTIEAGFQACNGWHFTGLSNIQWRIVFNGATIASGTGSGSVATNGYLKLGSGTVHYNRTQGGQTFGYSVVVTRTGSFAGTSTVNGSCWEGPLESHTVSYNGNGGSTPASQTKWYGTILTLQGTPSRAGYGFDGWKGSDGTTYSAGGQYTKDADCTMTAQWHQLYKEPTCTITAFRTSSASASTESPTGAYIRVSSAWKVDTSVTSGNAGKTVKTEYRVIGASSWTTAATTTVSGTSGTTAASFAAAAASGFEIRVTVTDTKQSTVFEARVGTAVAAIDVANKGKLVGIGTAVSGSETGVRLGYPAKYYSSAGTTQELGPVSLGFTDKVGCGLKVFRFGHVVCWRVQGNFIAGPAWGSKTLATGLPPASDQFRSAIAIQSEANMGANFFVDESGNLISEPKGNDLSSSKWIFASGTYIAKA